MVGGQSAMAVGYAEFLKVNKFALLRLVYLHYCYLFDGQFELASQ